MVAEAAVAEEAEEAVAEEAEEEVEAGVVANNRTPPTT